VYEPSWLEEIVIVADFVIVCTGLNVIVVLTDRVDDSTGLIEFGAVVVYDIVAVGLFDILC